MTIEELQNQVLELQEKNKTLTDKNKELSDTLITKDNDINSLNDTILNVRDLNAKLSLKVSNQILTPNDDKKVEENKEEKPLSFEELNKLI